jgi:hypothetical protein
MKLSIACIGKTLLLSEGALRRPCVESSVIALDAGLGVDEPGVRACMNELSADRVRVQQPQVSGTFVQLSAAIRLRLVGFKTSDKEKRQARALWHVLIRNNCRTKPPQWVNTGRGGYVLEARQMAATSARRGSRP